MKSHRLGHNKSTICVRDKEPNIKHEHIGSCVGELSCTKNGGRLQSYKQAPVDEDSCTVEQCILDAIISPKTLHTRTLGRASLGEVHTLSDRDALVVTKRRSGGPVHTSRN